MLKKRIKKGFTLIEVLAAMTLSVIVGYMAMQAIGSIMDNSNEIVVNSQSQISAREMNEELTQALSAAHASAQCLDGVQVPAGTVKKLSECTTPLSFKASPILYATGKCLVFNAYASSTQFGETVNDGVLRIPDTIAIKVGKTTVAQGSLDKLSIHRFTPEKVSTILGATKKETEFCKTGTAGAAIDVSSSRSTFLGENFIAPTTDIFSYYDAKGAKVIPTSATAALTPAQLASIAVIDVNGNFSNGKNDVNQTSEFQIKTSVVLPSTGYRNERLG